MPVRGSYLLIAGGGAIVLWSGIRGHKWSTVLRDIIGGKQLPQTTELAIQSSPSAFTSGGAGTGATTGGTSTAIGGSATKNKAIARVLAAPYGWATGSQWSALDALWTQESGWNNHARNPTSGAYGIPQALPPSKMGRLANPPTSSAGAQIAWGLRYIKTTPGYGNPVNAEAHERSQGWY